jgi:hypothetical protein
MIQFLNPKPFQMASTASIVLGIKRREVVKQALISECKVFAEKPSLLNTPYIVNAPVPSDVLDAFLSFVEGRDAPITPQNISGLWELSEEFGFGRFLSGISDFEAKLRSGTCS